MPRKQRFAPKRPAVREATPMTEDTKPGDPPKESQHIHHPAEASPSAGSDRRD